jgi:hypothetical protein
MRMPSIWTAKDPKGRSPFAPRALSRQRYKLPRGQPISTRRPRHSPTQRLRQPYHSEADRLDARGQLIVLMCARPVSPPDDDTRPARRRPEVMRGSRATEFAALVKAAKMGAWEPVGHLLCSVSWSVGIPTERLADPLDLSPLISTSAVTIGCPSGPTHWPRPSTALGSLGLQPWAPESPPPSDGASRSAEERSSPD